MKRCPTCSRTFTDPTLSFCIEDGTPLVPVSPADDETTIVGQSPGAGETPPTPYQPPDWRAPVYPPQGSPHSPGGQSGSRAWPWIAGIFAIVVLGFIALGIVGALLIPRALRSSAEDTPNSNTEQSTTVDNGANANDAAASSDSEPLDNNENTNTDAEVVDGSPPPTDKAKVLADLTELEHEWTVANINADKRKLEQILADDYVGGAEGERDRTKAEYLANLERDTSIETWAFEDLEVTLTGDRASLTGVLRIQFHNGPAAFRFTDKFVWRDGRWQAVSSRVKQLK